ncbi:acyl-CoA dehydrogenase C-terminal domain-containing protein [Methylocella sp.]|uniref:acyl-CoA dehydrogenase C-terminal domain-containing protein n=1 Tax=Methylocella sp. TaxID=1978226 RepID=UPI0037846490
MMSYKAPLRDMRFVLYELMGADEVAALPGHEEFSRELMDPILDEAARLCEDVLFPLNRPGDEEGCAFENGVVRTPEGFREAYRRYCEGGWSSLACDPAHGGLGAPHMLNVMITEMICSANLAFSLYPGLTHGAYLCLDEHGSDALKAEYLPKMASGEWSGTMCLTEPQCGTDLGLVRTRAEPRADGSYALSGSKMFISAGEHDLSDNIVHLVLARLPGAPKGVKGVSLFLAPKYLPRQDGAPGERNGVSCGSIEHKMGIRASATCVLNFDGATAFLVGAPHKGLRAMFSMMNAERLAVGVQGLGVGEAAYQGAAAYARERLQGRALKGAKYPEKPADPILVHPDVRRMLLTQRAYVEGCRALAAWAARSLDLRRSPDAAARREAEDFVALVTPIVKALLTDLGTEAANLGMQIMGGHGYIRENGMEQYARDARIAQIYEGTNGVQALDLIGRKTGAHAGRYLRAFFHPVSAYVEAKSGEAALAEFVEPLAKAFGRLQQATAETARAALRDPDEAGAAATDYLRLFGLVALAYLWARMAEIALQKQGAGEDDRFYAAKIATARFYMRRLLPQTSGLAAAIRAGAAPVMAFDDLAF